MGGSQPESYEELLKALIAAQLPGYVGHAEIVEWLPDVDYRPVHDRVVTEVGLSPALSTLIAMAANHVGKHRASARYNQHWLQLSFNPAKDYYAHADLGSTMTMIRDVDDDVQQ